MTNYSHLSYEDRKNIEDGLNENKSVNQIAKELVQLSNSILTFTTNNSRLNSNLHFFNKLMIFYFHTINGKTYEEFLKGFNNKILNIDEKVKKNQIEWKNYK